MERKFESKKEYLKNEKAKFTDLSKVSKVEQDYTTDLEKIKDEEYM